jgi:hypothetical protein
MILSVDATRLCLDCDILTESMVCPVCGRDRTFPVGAWLSPLKAARPPAAAHATFHVRRDLIRRRLTGELRPGRIAAMGDRAS